MRSLRIHIIAVPASNTEGANFAHVVSAEERSPHSKTPAPQEFVLGVNLPQVETLRSHPRSATVVDMRKNPLLFLLVFNSGCSGGTQENVAEPANDTTMGAGGQTVAGNESGAGGSVALAGIGGSPTPLETEMLSYKLDVAPLLARRCTVCHHTESAIQIDISNPFAPETGLLNTNNTWAEAYPDGGTPARNVVPFEPENSFLIQKISDTNLDTNVAGSFMPWAPPSVTDEELSALRKWITDGALNDDIFASEIRPILGVEDKLGGAGGKCTYCHHSKSGAILPNLTDPFNATSGAVGVESRARPGALLVAPGDPEASFLITKIEATTRSQTLMAGEGAAMPLRYNPLAEREVELIRQWIREGARDN